MQGLRLSLAVDTRTATMGGGTAFEAPSAPCANCLFPGLFPRRDTEEMGVLVRPGRGEPVCLKAGRKQRLGVRRVGGGRSRATFVPRQPPV